MNKAVEIQEKYAGSKVVNLPPRIFDVGLADEMEG